MAQPELAALDASQSLHDVAQKDLFVRTLPFMITAIAVELSLALPPGPASSPATIVSIGLLSLTFGLFVLPWKVLPGWMDVGIPLVYVASALALILAAPVSAGFGLVVLLPILWSSLNQELWKSLVVVVAATKILLTDYCVFLRRLGDSGRWKMSPRHRFRKHRPR